MAGRVPLPEAVDDDSAEAHLRAGLGRGVQRVVVAVEAVQQRGLERGGILEHGVGRLALGRRVVDRRGALGSAPVALRDVKCRARGARVHVARAGVDQVRLRLHHGARAALVIDAQHLGAGLEALACRGGGQGAEELDAALAVDDAGRVELGNAGDGDGLLGGVEVDHLLGVGLEGCGFVRACQ